MIPMKSPIAMSESRQSCQASPATARPARFEDDENLGEHLVTDGLEEAVHDQMVEAAQRRSGTGRLIHLSASNTLAVEESAAGHRTRRPFLPTAQDGLIARFRQVRDFSTRLCRGLATGRLCRPIDARRQPDEMASRAHDVVLRDLRPESLGRALSLRGSASTPTFLIPTTTPPATCTGAICAV